MCLAQLTDLHLTRVVPLSSRLANIIDQRRGTWSTGRIGTLQSRIGWVTVGENKSCLWTDGCVNDQSSQSSGLVAGK